MKWVIVIIIWFFLLIMFFLFVKREAYFPIQTKQNHFVQSSGTTFIIDNKEFVVNGVNDYDLAYADNKSIAHTFALLHSAGVTTIRFWLFGEGIVNGFQPQAGVYNETRFKQTDYILYLAHKYDMKVIPVLSNNWKDYGGKDQYVQWLGKNPADDTLFYKNDSTRTLFEKYISYVLLRKNTYTKQTYTVDTSILGWDIMNEPRSQDQGIMNSFLISIASFIKQKDKNHLVFAGTESADITSPRPSDQGKSSDLCANPAIDICSVHLYLFNNTQPLFTTYSEVTQFIKSQTSYAQRVHKPILMEEFGIANNTKPFGEDQFLVMKQVIQESKQDNYSGILIWDWSQMHKSSFTFSLNNTNYSLYSLKQLLSS